MLEAKRTRIDSVSMWPPGRRASHSKNAFHPLSLRSIVVALLFTMAGCSHDSGKKEEHGLGDAVVSRQAVSGPVTLTLSASNDDIALSDHLALQVVVSAPADVTVSPVEYQSALREGDHQFEYRVVHSSKQDGKPVEGDKLRWVYRYELEFFLPGDYELPAAEVSFVDVRQPGKKERDKEGESTSSQTLATQPLTIHVREPAAVMSPQELRNIARLHPVELRGSWSEWWGWAAAALVAVAAVALLILRRRRRGRADAVVTIPAHEWARRQIAALIAEDLIAKGCTQVFYYRVSAIVRGYIERRFGLSAPEMTTEEFLATAADDHRFRQSIIDNLQTSTQAGALPDGRVADIGRAGAQRDTILLNALDRFLRACDLVKYARHEPGLQESDEALKAAGDFVEQTRRRETDAGEDGSTVIEEQAA